MAEIAGVTRALERSEPPQEAALRRLIEAERQALDQTLDRLEERVHETFDWRRYVERHRGALAAVGSGAALLGLWRWRRRAGRSPSERIADAMVEGAREITDRACGALRMAGPALSIRRRFPRAVLAPLASVGLRAALRWWERKEAGAAPRPPAGEQAYEEERWRLERTLS